MSNSIVTLVVIILYVVVVLWFSSFGNREISLPDFAKCVVAGSANTAYVGTISLAASTSPSLSVIKDSGRSLIESGLASKYSFVKYDLSIKNECRIIPHKPLEESPEHQVIATPLSELQAQSEQNYNFTNLTCKRDQSIILKTNAEQMVPFSLNALSFEEILPSFLQTCTLTALASSSIPLFIATGTVNLILKPTLTSWLFSFLLSFALFTGIFPVAREAWRVVTKKEKYFSDK